MEHALQVPKDAEEIFELAEDAIFYIRIHIVVDIKNLQNILN
ncbi:hypothetical protein [Paenibacillus sp. GSMTC-2017]|nr:hypothetical protein [Paenibacillus sp. GSMTC-2017]